MLPCAWPPLPPAAAPAAAQAWPSLAHPAVSAPAALADAAAAVKRFQVSLGSAAQLVNDEGATVRLSTQAAYVGAYYCGRDLGHGVIPRSDGRCGPDAGPQCPSCKRYQSLRYGRVDDSVAEPFAMGDQVASYMERMCLPAPTLYAALGSPSAPKPAANDPGEGMSAYTMKLQAWVHMQVDERLRQFFGADAGAIATRTTSALIATERLGEEVRLCCESQQSLVLAVQSHDLAVEGMKRDVQRTTEREHFAQLLTAVGDISKETQRLKAQLLCAQEQLRLDAGWRAEVGAEVAQQLRDGGAVRDELILSSVERRLDQSRRCHDERWETVDLDGMQERLLAAVRKEVAAPLRGAVMDSHERLLATMRKEMAMAFRSEALAEVSIGRSLRSWQECRAASPARALGRDLGLEGLALMATPRESSALGRSQGGQSASTEDEGSRGEARSPSLGDCAGMAEAAASSFFSPGPGSSGSGGSSGAGRDVEELAAGAATRCTRCGNTGAADVFGHPCSCSHGERARRLDERWSAFARSSGVSVPSKGTQPCQA